ncbi:MAG TPA: GNAT family N-acetyltransferase [Pyrinomonadaceae bacterium]|nr:GNAT family N-acetyltransferase [Pyrinomonadaceae bacterium]
MLTIKQVETAEDIQATRQLFEEYVSELGVSLCFQNYDKEVAELPGEYRPPTGRLYFATENNEAAGCIALRKLDDEVCEMKRLFVRPQYRANRLGRALVDRVIEDARAIGYKRMRLDTLPGRMDQAIAMYRALGFKEIPRYYDNPWESALFMELRLVSSEQ